jgi:hypothetical protein
MIDLGAIMTKLIVRLALIVGSFACARGALAVEFAAYGGLSSMISYGQAIVVVSIQSGSETGPRTDSNNQWAVQRVKVLLVLKGHLTQDEIDVRLGPHLLFPTNPFVQSGFPIYEHYVLFLANDSSATGSYSIVNEQGSAFWIPRTADLVGLKPGDVRGNIEALAKAALSEAERTLDQCIRGYLSDDPPLRLASSCR